MADEKVVAAPDEKASTGVKGADPEAVAVKASTANDDDPSVKRVEDEDSQAFDEKEIHIGDERVHGPFKEEHVGVQDEHREVPADDPALHLEHDVTPAIDAVKKGGACVTGAQLMAPDERVENNKLGALAGKDVGAGEEELVTKAEAEAAVAKVGGPIGMIGAASAIENPSGVKGADTIAVAAKPSTAEDEKRADSEDHTIQDEHNKLGGAGKVVVEEALSGDKAGPSGSGTDDTAPPERGEQDGLDALSGMVSAHVTGAEQIPAAAADGDDDDSDHEDSDDEEDDDDDLAFPSS